MMASLDSPPLPPRPSLASPPPYPRLGGRQLRPPRTLLLAQDELAEDAMPDVLFAAASVVKFPPFSPLPDDALPLRAPPVDSDDDGGGSDLSLISVDGLGSGGGRLPPHPHPHSSLASPPPRRRRLRARPFFLSPPAGDLPPAGFPALPDLAAYGAPPELTAPSRRHLYGSSPLDGLLPLHHGLLAELATIGAALDGLARRRGGGPAPLRVYWRLARAWDGAERFARAGLAAETALLAASLPPLGGVVAPPERDAVVAALGRLLRRTRGAVGALVACPTGDRLGGLLRVVAELAACTRFYIDAVQAAAAAALRLEAAATASDASDGGGGGGRGGRGEPPAWGGAAAARRRAAAEAAAVGALRGERDWVGHAARLAGWMLPSELRSWKRRVLWPGERLAVAFWVADHARGGRKLIEDAAAE